MLQVTTVVSVSTIFMLLQDVGVAVNTTSLHGRALRILWRICQWPFVEGPVVVAHWRKGPCGTQLCGAHGACVDCVLWHTVCLLYVCNQLHPRLRQNLKHHNQALELASVAVATAPPNNARLCQSPIHDLRTMRALGLARAIPRQAAAHTTASASLLTQLLGQGSSPIH